MLKLTLSEFWVENLENDERIPMFKGSRVSQTSRSRLSQIEPTQSYPKQS